MNFFYAAQTYFDEWISFDRQAMKVLNFNSDSRPCAEEACKQLVAVATHYGIVRNFRRAYDGGETRLHGVWEILKDVEKPVSEQSAKDAVEALVAGLKSRYRQDLLSAASKFLWMRFGTPVVIYDSLTWGQLCQKPHPQCRGY